MKSIKIGFENSGEISGGIRWANLTNERLENEKSLELYGYKVYSQNDEDGIIEEIFNRIGTTNKTFIEFGVQNGIESNTHYLLLKNWKGLWIEGDEEFVKQINKKFNPIIKSGQLKVLNAFITKDNINHLFKSQGIEGEIDLLNIDIDGNDYYVFDCINVINPRVIIVEYNGKIPPDCEWVMPYNEYHMWDGSDKHGASLKSFELLGRKKGYQLAGTNINGVNAFFVRNDLAKELFLEPATAKYLFNPMRLYLRHTSGHPSSNCLHASREGMEGMFDYMEENALFLFGFHNEELLNDGVIIRWMNEKSAKLFIKLPLQSTSYIILNYRNGIPENYLEERLHFSVYVENGKKQNFEIEDLTGSIKIYIDDVSNKKEVIMIDVEINYLWKPSDVLKTGDSRMLGIAIETNTIQFVNNGV